MYGLVMLGRNIDGGDLLRYGIMAWLRDSLASPFCYCFVPHEGVGWGGGVTIHHHQVHDCIR